MALVVNLTSPSPTSLQSSPSTRHLPTTRSRQNDAAQQWTSLLHQLKSHGRLTCLFSGNSREDQARKALEGALGGKKDEFEKWGKEIKKREEVGGGSTGGGGGWFGGWGRRFGWKNEDEFWPEAQQASLALLGMSVMYLLERRTDARYCLQSVAVCLTRDKRCFLFHYLQSPKEDSTG